MPSVISALSYHAESQPMQCAIQHGQQSLSYAGLHAAVAAAATQLQVAAGSTIALAIGQGPAWAIADLAALASGMPCVPLPPFFTNAQQVHALRDAGVTLLLTDRPDFYAALLLQQGIPATRGDDIKLSGTGIAQFRLSLAPGQLPPGTAKVTYTSGTTGSPKGVCLSTAAMENVARALAAATGMTPADRHACLLPLATLLENIGGIYAPLLSGACVIPAPGQQDTDASTIAGNYGATLAGMLGRTCATTAIMIPQMLHALVAALENGVPRPAALRFVAVGGARVPPSLLARATTAGLPVYEGYGLSECASVVALNIPQCQRPGSVGKPLPHVQIDFAADGEILVRGAACLGYAGDATPVSETWPTGDLGHRDAEGFLHVTGRKKDIFITAFGRNVSPEWVESELVLQPAIVQAWVHGEARPWNAAVIVARPGATAADVAAAIAAANRNLPGYAQVRQWLPAREAFSGTNGELTTNGRLRRAAVAARYATDLEHLYTEYACEFS
jgi:long-chain acyl-CoA synthetase